VTTHPIIPGDLFARTQTISGLRALADFLENNPAVPVSEFGWEVSHYPEGTDQEQKAEVDRIAALLSVAPDNRRHYMASKTFGRITYRAVHIPARRMAAYDALMSYHPAFDASTDVETDAA
jgi:hypothetical protein